MPPSSPQFRSSDRNRKNGRSGERIVVAYLQEQGWQIIAQNLRYRGSELDVICFKDDVLVVVEVKQRMRSLELQEDLLPYRKCCALRRGTDALICDEKYKAWISQAKTIRCDLIVVDNGGLVQHWTENAVTLG